MPRLCVSSNHHHLLNTTNNGVTGQRTVTVQTSDHPSLRSNRGERWSNMDRLVTAGYQFGNADYKKMVKRAFYFFNLPPPLCQSVCVASQLLIKAQSREQLTGIGTIDPLWRKPTFLQPFFSNTSLFVFFFFVQTLIVPF